MRVRRASGPAARKQAAWIAAMEPWRGMGYSAAGLARWLDRMGRAGRVRMAFEGDDARGVIVVQPDVLLGDFIALVAVHPLHAGRGVGRALVETVALRSKRRWLYVSSDAANIDAARFYRRLGFTRVATLPDLVRDGRAELLWRRAISPRATRTAGARRGARPPGVARRSPARRRR